MIDETTMVDVQARATTMDALLHNATITAVLLHREMTTEDLLLVETRTGDHRVMIANMDDHHHRETRTVVYQVRRPSRMALDKVDHHLQLRMDDRLSEPDHLPRRHHHETETTEMRFGPCLGRWTKMEVGNYLSGS
jgi:hypothetical protein